jgi:phage terminase small subunit
MSEKLTVKELKFVAGIIKGLSQTEACINAGYSKNGASTQATKLMRKPSVQGEIEKQVSGQGWTPEKVIGELQDLYFRAKEAEAWAPAKDMLTLLGRHVGVLKDERTTKTEVSHSFELLLDKAKDITPEPLQLNDSRTLPVHISQEKDTPHVN